MPGWLQSLISEHGYWVVLGTVFLNNLGFPIPGDSTLLGAGFFAQKGVLSFGGVVAAGTAACFMGGNAGYGLGRWWGRRLLKKISWLRMTPERISRIEHYFGKYGAKAVFFARFVALLHPVTGLLSGVWRTPFRPFLFYNLAGSASYAFLFTLAGYYLGKKLESLKAWASPAILYLFLIAGGLLVLWWFLRRSIHDFIVHHLPNNGPGADSRGKPGTGKRR